MIAGCIRRFLRITALIFFLPLTWFMSLCTKYGPEWDRIARVSFVTRRWAKGLAAILGVKITLHRPENYPTSGLIISNHTSYLDILISGAVFPVRFMPKSDIKKWPVLGPYLGSSLPIWVNRSTPVKAGKVAAEMVDTMQHGIPLVVYPEGTTGDGSALKKFKSTAFEAAIAAGGKTPLLPMLIIYRNTEMNVAWYGDMTLMPHLWQVLGLRRIKADVYLLDPVYPEENEDRKMLALRMQKIMSERYVREKNAGTENI